MQRTVASELILGVRNTEGRLSKMLCDATKYFDERPSPEICVTRAPDAPMGWNSKVAKNSSKRATSL